MLGSGPIFAMGKSGGRSSRKEKNRSSIMDDYDDDFVVGSYQSSAGGSVTRYSKSAPSMSAFTSSNAPRPPLKPRNDTQKRYMDLLEKPDPAIVVVSGPAGCAKTLIASYVAMSKLIDGHIDRLVITRPCVSVDEEIGFLPGDVSQKMAPWLKPITDVFYKYFPSKTVDAMFENDVISICPLAYMRGMSFDGAWILADECQNMLPSQMLMLLTRIGKNSKLIVTGDTMQHDRKFERNGLSDLIEKLEGNRIRSEHIERIIFNENDVERHPVIKHVLKMYT